MVLIKQYNLREKVYEWKSQKQCYIQMARTVTSVTCQTLTEEEFRTSSVGFKFLNDTDAKKKGIKIVAATFTVLLFFSSLST